MKRNPSTIFPLIIALVAITSPLHAQTVADFGAINVPDINVSSGVRTFNSWVGTSGATLQTDTLPGGQKVLEVGPFNGGSAFGKGSLYGPTVSTLDLSSATGISLTLRLLPDNAAPWIFVNLFSASNPSDGPLFAFSADKFSTSDFNTVSVSFSDARPGPPGFDFSKITAWEVVAEPADGTPTRLQLQGIAAVPEPRSILLAVATLGGFALARFLRRG